MRLVAVLAVLARGVASAQEAELSKHPVLVKMLEVNNRLRASVGLPAHKIDERLTCAAQNHACWMAEHNSMQHYSNGGPSGRAQRYGFSGGVRENIAYGAQDLEGAFRMWRNSGGHWANITSGTNLAGFGQQRASNGTLYFAAVYGSE